MKSNHKWFLFFALSVSVAVQADEVSREQWIQSMSTALPAVFCQDNQYFRKCFKVTPQECEATAASATRVCLNNIREKIPATLVQPRDGAQWGHTLGSCAGEAYELALLKKRISNEVCNNPDHWK